MPSWSAKDQRQYEHIKESALKRGQNTRRAKEIAGRTVNKERRQEGRTANGGKGTSSSKDGGLENSTRQELYDRAKKMGIEGRSKMSKRELAKTIKKDG